MMNSDSQPQQPTTQPMNQGAGGNGDMLDKGVDFAEREAGHEQSHATTEKISDAARTGYKDTTGKDVPIQDKQYS
ncbi:hypothetical protein PUNSTDRAFT_134077 [Punctularia strigosozonata HHB-11173 SS5]|uniref:uncharacterized protein n=1 Tax=Punctularia strigosozonata (strain HHB-11173) TaxID=741275 RepID=UPI00044183DA|nr:uncharacterized protein PUNSTDRAFT_134077 [Punctularia strigosozonata HHB-11173 SS5]EIN08903.1 hypothetical protein PUNSTDRAFT_134077 [Punctularia strigosozonata HHB-11173 SS5]